MGTELKDFLSVVRKFKFMTTLVLEFDNIEPLIQSQKQNQLLMKVTLIMYLIQSIGRLYQTYKNLLEKSQAGLFIQLSITLLMCQRTIP